MKPLSKLLLAAAVPAIAIVPVVVLDDEPPPALVDRCASVPPPAPPFDIVLEAKPTRYAGPFCAEGETCVTPPDWEQDPAVELTPEGARYTVTYAGELRALEGGGSEELVMLPAPELPECWAWKWRKVTP